MMNEMINEICRLMVQLIRFNRYDELQQTLEEIQEIEETQEIQNETLNEIREAAEIYRTESESGTGEHSAWFDEHSWEQIQMEYRFTLQDFYKMNAQRMPSDTALGVT